MSGGKCPNCGAQATRRFCPECGQRQGEETTKLRFWLRQTAEEYFSLNGRVPRSLRLLLLHPGRLTVEWQRGRRARYSNPLRLALLGAVVMVAVVGATFPDEPLSTRFLPLALLATSPALAALLAGLERASGETYLEHTVTVLHLQATYFLVHAVPLLGAIDGLPAPGVFEALGGLAFAWGIVYTVLAIRRVYGDSWTAAILKAVSFHLIWWFLFGLALGLAGSAADVIGTGADRLLTGAFGTARV